MVNKVRIEIAGSRYVIATPEGEERVLSLGREIDAQVRQLMDGNDRVSLNDALVLCCLNYANAYKKSEESADNMRTQLTDYLEDATLARIELDETKRENERLKQIAQRRHHVDMRNQSVDDLTVGLRPRHPHDQRYADPAVRPSCKERRE